MILGSNGAARTADILIFAAIFSRVCSDDGVREPRGLIGNDVDQYQIQISTILQLVVTLIGTPVVHQYLLEYLQLVVNSTIDDFVDQLRLITNRDMEE